MTDRLSPLATPAATREVLQEHGLATKHALGQNFLINDRILQKIIELSGVERTDTVLEVGPGIGTLTIALLKHAGEVVAIERDPDLPAVLAATLAPWNERFTLIEKDALDVRDTDLPQSPGKLVSNLPYAVAATVVLDYFQRFASLRSATVMVQKEVADRMAAMPGTKDYGAYTLKLSLYAKPAGRFPVGPNNFFPPPRVDSAVIRLDRIAPCDANGDSLTPEQIVEACMWADAAFTNRRKTILNSCKTYFASRGAQGAAIAADLPAILEAAAIDPRRRGETLTTDDLIRVALASERVR